MTNLGPTKRAIYDHLKYEGRSTIDELANELDMLENQVYGCAKHLYWDGYLDHKLGEEWWVIEEVVGLCPACEAETVYAENETTECCPKCDWIEEWVCSDCGSTDPHHAIEVMDGEIEVDVTCEEVYFTFTDDDWGMCFDLDTFEEVIEHFNDRPDFDT